MKVQSCVVLANTRNWEKGPPSPHLAIPCCHFFSTNTACFDNLPIISMDNLQFLFSMDFSKAFDSVNHELLCDKLKKWPLNKYIINWFIDFLRNRCQRVCLQGVVTVWKHVNKGTTQGSVSGPYLFALFLDDLDIDRPPLISLSKYADDTTIQVAINNSSDLSNEAVSYYLDWSEDNLMKCNPKKCKEVTLRKQGQGRV